MSFETWICVACTVFSWAAVLLIRSILKTQQGNIQFLRSLLLRDREQSGEILRLLQERTADENDADWWKEKE